MYTQTEDLDDLLKIGKGVAPAGPVLGAFKSLLRHPPNRAEMTGLCNQMSSCSEVTCKVLLQSLRRLNPKGSSDQHECGMAVMRALMRCKCNELYKVLVDSLREVYDKFLTEAAWCRNLGTGTTPTVWCKMQDASLYLVLPKMATERVLTHPSTEPLNSISEDIKHVVESSTIGDRLFRPCVKTIVQEDIVRLVKQAQLAMAEKSTVGETALLELMQVHQAKLDGIRCVSMVEQKRVTSVTYRGLELKVTVRSLSEELEFALRATTRAAGVSQELLPALPGEEAVAKETNSPLQNVDEDVLRRPAAARKFLLQVLSEEGTDAELSGDHVMATVKLHATKLYALDKLWLIDYAILQHITGDAGAELLKDAFFSKCLPTKDAALEVADALKNAQGIVDSAAYKWASAGSKNELRVGLEMLQRLKAEEPIIIGTGVATTWLHRVQTSMQYFLRVTVQQQKKTDDEKAPVEMVDVTLTGQEALQSEWARLKTVRPVVLDNYRQFSVWRHMMSPTMEAELAELRKHTLADATKVMKTVESKSVAVPKRTSKKRNVEAEVDEAALSILGMC
eukprot:6487084-Amphidinium_carterae.1